MRNCIVSYIDPQDKVIMYYPDSKLTVTKSASSNSYYLSVEFTK